MQQIYHDALPRNAALIQSIFAQIELYNGNHDNCLEAIERTIEYFPLVSLSNNIVFYPALLCIFAMYHILQKVSSHHKADGEIVKHSSYALDFGNLIRKASFIPRGRLSSVDTQKKPAGKPHDETSIITMDRSTDQAQTSGSREAGKIAREISLDKPRFSVGNKFAQFLASPSMRSNEGKSPLQSDTASPKQNATSILMRMQSIRNSEGRDSVSQRHEAGRVAPDEYRTSVASRFSKFSREESSPAPNKKKVQKMNSFSRADAYNLKKSYGGNQDEAPVELLMPPDDLVRRNTRINASTGVKARTRRLASALQRVLGTFSGHSVHKPFDLLIQGLLSMNETMTLFDTPNRLKAWTSETGEDSDMRYLVAIVAVKSWRVSGQRPEWVGERNLGKNILEDLNLPEEIEFAHDTVDYV